MDDYWQELEALEKREQMALRKMGVLPEAVQEDLDNIQYWKQEHPAPRDIIYQHGYRVA